MKLLLRPWHKDDLHRLVLLANNSKIADNLTDKFPHPYTRESGENFIQYASTHGLNVIKAIELDGLLAGGVGLHPQEDIFCNNAELGYWLAEEYWGQGIMTMVVKEMVKFGFQNLDITRIFARPFGTNIGSQKVLGKAGFILEARFSQTIIKNGRLEDELIYAIRKSDFENL